MIARSLRDKQPLDSFAVGASAGPTALTTLAPGGGRPWTVLQKAAGAELFRKTLVPGEAAHVADLESLLFVLQGDAEIIQEGVVSLLPSLGSAAIPCSARVCVGNPSASETLHLLHYHLAQRDPSTSAVAELTPHGQPLPTPAPDGSAITLLAAARAGGGSLITAKTPENF